MKRLLSASEFRMHRSRADQMLGSLASEALEAQLRLNKIMQPMVSLLLTDHVGPCHNFQSPGLILMTAAVEVSV